jgi:hypothetical protein
MSGSHKSAVLRRRIHDSHNPYASDQLFDPNEDSVDIVLTVEERRALENPYAPPPMAVAPRDSKAPREIPRSIDDIVLTATKTEFVSECGRIFRQYLPAVEKKGQLRDHHRAFISRNSWKSPRTRRQLLRELSKYDLSDVRGVEAQFNRENDVITDEKLRKIERKVIGD